MADRDSTDVADEIAKLEEELAAKKLELEAAQRKATFQEYPKYLMDPDDSSKGVTVGSAEEEEKILAARAEKSGKAPVTPAPVPVTIVPEGTPKPVAPLAPPPPPPTADDLDDAPEPAKKKGGR